MFESTPRRFRFTLVLLAALQMHVGCKTEAPRSEPPPRDDSPPTGNIGGESTGPPAPPSPDGASFFDDFDAAEVDDSVWKVADWVEHGGQTSPERCYLENGHLKMVFINDSTHGYLSSAIQTRKEFLYGRWEARLKPSSVPGVLNSMYTIDWDDISNAGSTSDGTKQEIDIEFLTYSFTGNDGRVHYAVHASGLPSTATKPDILLGFDPSADFHVWGFDITPDKIEWFVDDRVLWAYVYAEKAIVIDAHYMLKFNVWSMERWINGPPVPNTENVYLIDWVRFIPYEE